MKLNPGTLALVLIALVLAGVVYLTQGQDTSQVNGNEPKAQPQQILTFQPSQVQALTLKTQLRTLEFERDQQGTWQMQQPDQVAADEAAINYLLSLMVGTSRDRPFTVPKSQQQDFGFHQPTGVIEVRLASNDTHRLMVGGYNFNRASLYAQVDPSATGEELTVLLVPAEFDTAINRSLAEWKAQAPTPTP